MESAGVSSSEVSTTMRILIVGREGNGKSSCLETIEKTSGTEHEIFAEKCDGVGDTGEDLKEDIQTVVNNVLTKLENSQITYPVAAIVLVMKYGTRFTKQEKEAVEVVKLMFGNDVFSKYGVLLFTYGDTFTKDNEGDNNRTFVDWCKDQTGDIERLFQEVNNRIVLFDNKTKETTRQEEQCNTLYDIVRSMDVKYGIKEFNKARSERQKLINRFTKTAGSTVTENIGNINNESNIDSNNESNSDSNNDSNCGIKFTLRILPCLTFIMTWLSVFIILIVYLTKECATSTLGIILTLLVFVWIMFGLLLIYTRDKVLIYLHLKYPILSGYSEI